MAKKIIGGVASRYKSGNDIHMTVDRETINFKKNNSTEIGKEPFSSWEKVAENIYKTQQKMMPQGSTFDATQIPATRSIFGNILQNNSSLSILSSQEMVYSDSVIYSSLMYNRILTISRIGKYRNKNNIELENIVNYSLENSRIGKRRLLEALETRKWAGFSAIFKQLGVHKGKWIYKNFIPMPPTSIIMTCDNSGMLNQHGGICQYYYNFNMNGWANSFSSGGVATNPNIPIGDFPYPLRVPYINPMYLKAFNLNDVILHTFSGLDGTINPYGRMITRSCWQHYINKQALFQNILIAYTYKASPLLLFYVDPTKNVVLPNGSILDVAADIKNNLETFNGNGFMVIRGKHKELVEHATIDNTADIGKMWEGVHQLDRQMMHGLLTPASALDTDGNFATSLSQSTLYGKGVDYDTQDICETLLHQIVKPLAEMNFGSHEYLGYFEIVEQDLDDKLKLQKLFEGGLQNNIICQDPTQNKQTLSDLNMMREKLGYEDVNKIFMNPNADNSPTNVSDTNRETNTSYADGIQNYKKRYE